ncbi:Vegetative incompatibility protein HET-E-1 [Fusarium oxysporum]|uniref:Vegetative incompatibility protein HET-E-1 n=1 Tax=Fusarium oxysporum TaxID=5507 RepID=A0A420MEN0_FUSOX|nr:Vegetative incompatibility protein HET-E-1 [Fusarium oxysporum]
MTDMHIGKAANVGHVEIAQQTNNVYDTDVEKDSCLKDLYVTNPSADKKRIERDKGGLLKDCYSWILYNDNFVQWRDDPEQHLLWIKGDPGKGKTMLLAGLITELEKTSHDGIFYFFCQAARPSHRTASNVLRGVIWFIINKRPGLKSYVRREYDQAGSNIFTDHNAWYALSEVLTAILEDKTSADCIIIIDALDECIEGREKLIGYIIQCSISCKAKWVISSRNWPEIESQLDAAQSQVRLQLELNHAPISDAVIKFVDRKINQLNSTFDELARERIRKHLLDNANDTFLWVALVCQELGKPGVNNYHSSNILKRFPAGLNELYARMVCDIKEQDMDWCRAILAVIAVALRPLSLQELAAADEILTEWVEDKKTLSSLVTSCGSLLTIRENKVYTVHQSVNDFLRTTPKILPSGIGQQHYSILDCSLNVMHDRLHRNLYKLEDSCVLIEEMDVLEGSSLTIVGYACVYWVDHFCAWLLTDNQHQNNFCYTMITQFLENKYLYWLEAIEAMQRLEDKLEGRVSDELKLLVKDAVRFASKHRTIMDVAPLQLYDSALILTPRLSKIKGCFNQEINKFIDVFSPNFQRWDACLQTIPGIASRFDNSAICEFSPDGGQVATISSNADSLLLMDASTGGLVKSIESPGGRLHKFTFYPSGDHLVTLSGDTRDETRLSIFHLPNVERSKSFTFLKSSGSAILSVSPDGKLLAIASDYHTVDIWHMASETKVDSCHTIPGCFILYIFWINIPSHPQALLILGWDDISIWGLDTRHQASKLMSLKGIELSDAATISRDRACCAVFQGRKELVLYSWGSSITVQKIARFDRMKYVNDASWVADGRLIALCGDFGIELWDLEAKRLVAQVRGDPAKTICYGRNRQLASLGFQIGTLKIWSLDTILSHSKPTTQQSASIVRAFITSPSGKVAVISNNAKFDMLSIVVDGRFHHLPKTLQNSPPVAYYITESLVFGHDDYFAVATDLGAIDVFNFDHDTGLYYCERRIGEHSTDRIRFKDCMIIQFWSQGQIMTLDTRIRFWDLKTGICSRVLSIPIESWNIRSAVTADGRVAMAKRLHSAWIVIWDIMNGKEIQHFELGGLLDHPDLVFSLSLDSRGILAICTQRYIFIGNANDGTWIRGYSLSAVVPRMTFLTPGLRLDTGFGVLKYDLRDDGSDDMPRLVADDYWDPRYLRLSYTKSEAWLMKGSRRILWIPRQDVDPKRFSIQTDLATVNSVMSTVEINDAVFCQEHLAEICEDCSVDLREENDAFYGFDSVERDAIESPHASINNDGVYMCKKHDSATCNQCFGWKKMITKARMDAKRAGKH